jgi:hypothetical protein
MNNMKQGNQFAIRAEPGTGLSVEAGNATRAAIKGKPVIFDPTGEFFERRLNDDKMKRIPMQPVFPPRTIIKPLIGLLVAVSGGRVWWRTQKRR